MTSWSSRAAATLIVFWAATAAAASAVEDVAGAQLAALRAQGAVVIDVRRADEWRGTGVIDGSRRVTAFDASGTLDPAFINAVTKAVRPDQPVVLVCRSGRRSTAAAHILAEQAGFRRLYNLEGGILEWVGDGRALTPCPRC